MDFAKLDFSYLDNFFSLNVDQKKEIVFKFGQEQLLPLEGKILEKACSELVSYFRRHPQISDAKNLIVPTVYWGHDKETIQDRQLNYSFKEYLMNILVYKDCLYVVFDSDNNIHWDTDSTHPRYSSRNTADRKTHPEKKIRVSHFSLAQKDIIWSGISVGYIDVPEATTKAAKSKKKTVDNDSEFASEDVTPEDIKVKAPSKKYSPDQVQSPMMFSYSTENPTDDKKEKNEEKEKDAQIESKKEVTKKEKPATSKKETKTPAKAKVVKKKSI